MSNADPMDKWDGTNASVCRKCRGRGMIELPPIELLRGVCYEEEGEREKRDFATPLRGLTFLPERNFCPKVFDKLPIFMIYRGTAPCRTEIVAGVRYLVGTFSKFRDLTQFSS